ncbi:MAG TPA: ABC transporter permease [Gemmatimonadaceae bacterium]|nr:ABC transporter permease [Gemmatimonadaceae bacterium]
MIGDARGPAEHRPAEHRLPEHRPAGVAAARLSLRRLLAIARKEAIQLKRDPRSLGIAFVVPAFMIVFFGYVISFDVTDIKLAVLDQDHTARSRELVESFEAAGRFRVTDRPADHRAIERLLDRGAIRMALVIPPGFARTLAAGSGAPVQALVDGADANTAAIALNYATAIVTAYSARVVLRTAQRTPPVAVEARVWYNETLASSNMIVPGLVAVIMMIIAAMLTSLTVAREWERGTMEQLAATPVHPAEVILGKLIPYLGIGLVDITAAVLLGMFVFEVPFRGSPILLFGMATLFLVGSLGLGIFISAAVKSQLLATQIAMMATYMPSLLLSGLLFDLGSMPAVLRVISTIVPARYFIVVLRGVFLKGVGVDVLWAQGLGMILFAVVGLSLAVRSFRKEIA